MINYLEILRLNHHRYISCSQPQNRKVENIYAKMPIIACVLRSTVDHHAATESLR